MKNQSKIKIVQIITDSNLGGGASHVLGILRNIDQNKFEPYLICPSGFLATEAGKISGVKIFKVKMQSKFDLLSIFGVRDILFKIQSTNNHFCPMIVHSHGPRAHLFANFLPSNIRSVYTEHIYNEDYHLKNPLNERLQKALLKFLNKKTDLVLAVSNSTKNFLIKSGIADKAKVVVIPNGIELSSQLNVKKKIKELNLAPIIGTIGSLNEQKGHEYLIKSLPVILQRYPLVSLEIIGSGELLNSLKSLVKSLKLERHVSFLGRQKNVDKYLRHWDVFVLPSISETFGIVLLEAMAAGVPLVATRAGGITDIISNKRNGLLVATKDSESIAKAIINIIDKPALAAQLKRGGLDRVTVFEWKKVIVKLENAYETLTDVAEENV